MKKVTCDTEERIWKLRNQVIKLCMESSSPWKTGDQFYQAGELKFSPTSGGGYLNEGFKIFHNLVKGQKKNFVKVCFLTPS